MIYFESYIFFQFQNLNEKINYRDRKRKIDEYTKFDNNALINKC